MDDDSDRDRLLTPTEVADMFRVTVHTVGRWASQGDLPVVRTPGGHRRYWLSAIRDMLDLPLPR